MFNHNLSTTTPEEKSSPSTIDLNFILFNRLIEAIKDQQVSIVKSIIKLNPALLLQEDPELGTPLHVALSSRNSSISELIISLLKEKFPDDFAKVLRTRNAKGNTPLHLGLACNESKICQLLINSDSNAPELLLALNNEGYSPIHMLTDRKVEYLEKKNAIENYDATALRQEQINLIQITLAVEKHLIHKPMLELDAKMNIADVLQQHADYIEDNEELAFNLYYGCMVVNLSRQVVLASATHPTTNNLTKQATDELCEKCDAIFEIVTKALKHYKTTQLHNDNSAAWDQHLLLFLENMFIQIKKAGAGDCAIISLVAMYIALKLGINTPVQVCDLKPNGNHTFLQLGKGKNAVIIDAWSGQVYPADKKADFLHGYTSYYSNKYGKTMNLLFPFNPAVHQIVSIIFKGQISEKYFQENTIDTSFFNTNEIDELKSNQKVVEDFLVNAKFKYGTSNDHLKLYKQSQSESKTNTTNNQPDTEFNPL